MDQGNNSDNLKIDWVVCISNIFSDISLWTPHITSFQLDNVLEKSVNTSNNQIVTFILKYCQKNISRKCKPFSKKLIETCHELILYFLSVNNIHMWLFYSRIIEVLICVPLHSLSPLQQSSILNLDDLQWEQCRWK